MVPRSTLPVTTVPRPSIEKTSSIGIIKGESKSRSGVGILLSNALIKSLIHLVSSESISPRSNASIAFCADPNTKVTSI